MSFRIFAILALLSGASLQAQTTGDAAATSTETAKANNWQNWAFAGTALVTAAASVIVVSLNDGHGVTGH